MADWNSRCGDDDEAARLVAAADRIDQLERENAALRADNLKTHQMACAAGLERDRLRDELAALRQDKERLEGVVEAFLRTLGKWKDTQP
jgi:uncharacterized protein (UPF0335 family)